MAETQPKRSREESHQQDASSEFDDSAATDSKRQKPYNNILNLLDEEEEEVEPSLEPSHELSQGLSAIFTTLQQELSSSTTCDSSSTAALEFGSPPCAEVVGAAAPSHNPSTGSDASAECGGGDEGEFLKSVMRHLLEASDDELGIPNGSGDTNTEILESGENVPFSLAEHDGLWELEDETANYYTVLQSQLFMQ